MYLLYYMKDKIEVLDISSGKWYSAWAVKGHTMSLVAVGDLTPNAEFGRMKTHLLCPLPHPGIKCETLSLASMNGMVTLVNYIWWLFE